jgi:hypothetical protein
MSMIEEVIEYFDNHGFKYCQVPGKSTLNLGITGRSGKWFLSAQVIEDRTCFALYSRFPIEITRNKFSDICEFIARANYGLLIGNFELCYEMGEVRYKTSIDFGETGLNKDLIHQLIRANLATMDRYFPGIMAVIFGNISPEEAISKVEGRLVENQKEDDELLKEIDKILQDANPS